MKLEKITDEKGKIVFVVINGKKIHNGRSYGTEISDNLFVKYVIWPSGDVSLDLMSVNPNDRTDKTEVNLEYSELGDLQEIASLKINVDNYSSHHDYRQHKYELTQTLTSASISGSGYDFEGYNAKTIDKIELDLENENKEAYDNSLLRLLFNDQIISNSSISTEGKDILMSFIDEITSRFISCKYRKAPKIMKAIDTEKQEIQSELDEYIASQLQHVKIYGKENVLFARKIKNLQNKISTYDSVITKIKPTNKTL